MATRAFPTPDPLGLLLAAIPGLPRPVLAHLAARLIERLDEIDGDPEDQQDDGDSSDGSMAEDDFRDHEPGNGPGCAISDPDCCAAGDDDPTRGGDDGAPGDGDDAEDNGDREQVFFG